MNRLRLILRSLAFYRRTHLGVVAGTAVSAAVLTGALIVGDSVNHTLRQQAEWRIGQIDDVMVTNDRMFRDNPVSDRILTNGQWYEHAAPVLFVRGVVTTPDGAQIARQVNVLGVDDRFFEFAPDPVAPRTPDPGRALVNERLAMQLHSESGQELIVRVEKPSALPRDSVLGTIQDMSLALRVTATDVVTADDFGRFDLQHNQIPPQNLYVPIGWLQEQIEVPGRANSLLLRTGAHDPLLLPPQDELRRALRFEDYQLSLRMVSVGGETEVISDRIFIGREEEAAIRASDALLTGILTYFVNSIERGDESTPYSMVTAIGPVPGRADWSAGDVLPNDLGPDDIVINQWLADDLGASEGDEIILRYFVLDEVTDRLREDEAGFVVRTVIPIEGIAADRTLMPDFPGIADAENSRDWQPGIPIDLGRIRDKDEDYWDDHRGTPKAFISLERGRKLWGNRYGELTAVRFDAAAIGDIREAVESSIDPASLGFVLRDVRASALQAANATTDFGGLFLGLSIFLIAASLLLTGLLFALNIDQRSREIGTLLAIGYTPHAVRMQLTKEGGALAVIGALIGAGLGVTYTVVILAALRGIWSEAVASAEINLAVRPSTMITGALAIIITSLLVMWFTLGHKVRQNPVELIRQSAASATHTSAVQRRPLITLVCAVLSLIGAIAMILTVGANPRQASMGFFGAGALVLVGGLCASRFLLRMLRSPSSPTAPTVNGLALRNTTRRPGRSLTTVSLLACGVFLVLAVAANRLDATVDADARDSGTGGFAFFGETSIPVVYDLNEARGRDAFGLAEDELNGVSFVSLRVRKGDDASCLNLNTAQRPRLLGVDPESLASRGAFRFVRVLDGLDLTDGWNLLDATLSEGAIPAIVDDASATWALHKSVGDSIEYVNDRGQPVRVVIVGTIGNSILQGAMMISESQFKSNFDSVAGAQVFLIDAPPGERDELAARLQRALSDAGLEITPATRRLADFNAVQNSYLAIFQMLGGLGLLLGSVGLGLIVARNILERRSELALLRAMGFGLGPVRTLIRREHLLILLLGTGIGAIAAVIALIPAFRSQTSDPPYLLMVMLTGLLLANGVFWVWLATRQSLSRDLVAALRDE